PLATPARLATSSSRAVANPLAENSSSAASRIASRRGAALALRALCRDAAMTPARPALLPPVRPGPILSKRVTAAFACRFAVFAIVLNMTDQSVIVKKAAPAFALCRGDVVPRGGHGEPGVE